MTTRTVFEFYTLAILRVIRKGSLASLFPVPFERWTLSCLRLAFSSVPFERRACEVPFAFHYLCHDRILFNVGPFGKHFPALCFLWPAFYRGSIVFRNTRETRSSLTLENSIRFFLPLAIRFSFYSDKLQLDLIEIRLLLSSIILCGK